MLTFIVQTETYIPLGCNFEMLFFFISRVQLTERFHTEVIYNLSREIKKIRAIAYILSQWKVCKPYENIPWNDTMVFHGI